MTHPEFITGDEAARLLGVKKATLYAYVSRGVLRSYRQGIGRHSLYRRSDIETLRAIDSPDAPPDRSDDDVFRDVYLPNADSWAGDH